MLNGTKQQLKDRVKRRKRRRENVDEGVWNPCECLDRSEIAAEEEEGKEGGKGLAGILWK